ncbi:MAG: oligoendopeptidase F [Ruminococcaceae bacterium]|nr:oligoendopeptidase F [Oscillospiraceae bacterium]
MILERKDIDPKYKWDLSVIYPDEKTFNEDYLEVEKEIRAYAVHETTMSESPEHLYAALKAKYHISDRLSKLWQFASLNACVDLADSGAQARQTRVRNLYTLFGETAWFISTRILSLDDETLKAWVEAYPPLAEFRRVLEGYMRWRPHLLSDECEKLRADMSDALDSHSEIYTLLTGADMRFGFIRGEDGKRTELTDTNYATFMMSAERRVRRAAFGTIYKTYDGFKNTVAALYEARIKEEVVCAKVRKYPDSLTASTDGDEVTPEIYNNLIASVRRGLPTLYDYYEMKREILGLPKMHLYDVYVPLVGAYDRKYTYEEAVDEVLKTVSVFGDEYVKTLKEGLMSRGWADVYPSRGKRGGAFSSSGALTEPYILLNFKERLDDVSTLAHEAGHSMHSWYSKNANPTQNSHPTLFVAEVASTVNELLLAHRKLKESESREERLYVLNRLLESYKATLFRQTMFAEFERDMHAAVERGEPLTADAISKHYFALVQLYFGDGVVCDAGIAYEWERIPHFYRCFYVYKYATCISAASTIVKRIEAEGAPYVKKYLDFLRCGSAKSPLDSLLVAEVDMRKPEVIENAIADFADALRQFKEQYYEK